MIVDYAGPDGLDPGAWGMVCSFATLVDINAIADAIRGRIPDQHFAIECRPNRAAGDERRWFRLYLSTARYPLGAIVGQHDVWGETRDYLRGVFPEPNLHISVER